MRNWKTVEAKSRQPMPMGGWTAGGLAETTAAASHPLGHPRATPIYPPQSQSHQLASYSRRAAFYCFLSVLLAEQTPKYKTSWESTYIPLTPTFTATATHSRPNTDTAIWMQMLQPEMKPTMPLIYLCTCGFDFVAALSSPSAVCLLLFCVFAI